MATITRVTHYFGQHEVLKDRRWWIVDAQGKSLGRLAGRIAIVLSGKHKPVYTPQTDTGDHVIVVNAEKVRLTGKKMQTKTKFRHSGYPGGAVHEDMQSLMKRHPERAITLAVKGMLPKTHMGRKMITKLNVYKGSEHPHKAQMAEEIPARLMQL